MDLDAINHPNHYVKGRKYEPLHVIEDWGLIYNYYLANAVKYIARYGRKDVEDPKDDLRKAVFYLQRAIDRG